jgi:hypothetical protein
MSDTTARLGLPVILPSQAQKHVTHNEALVLLDGITQLVLTAQGGTVPPALPAAGDIYALSPAPTGVWAGQADKLAQWVGSHWQFIAPQEGWMAWDLGEAALLTYQGGQWQSVLDSFATLGIGTSADTTNRLAVASQATLLTHDGAGHQVKINKAGAAETASLLYQSNWAGRAEMGLTGDDDFHIKVSPDGAAWTEALVVDAATGRLSGSAVQSDQADATAGRVLTVGAFGLGGMLSYSSDDDFDTMLPGFIGNAGNSSVPANAPDTSGRWSGFFAAGSRNTGLQVLVRGDAEEEFVMRKMGFDESWTDWATIFTHFNILGTVSQNAGKPTGALVERGANGNGAYARFADGTQICTHEVLLGDPTATGSGTHADPYMAPAAGVDIVFPVAFVAPPALSVTHSVIGGGAGPLSRVFAPSHGAVTATDVPEYRAVRMTGNGDTAAVTVVYTAIGRWF